MFPHQSLLLSGEAFGHSVMTPLYPGYDHNHMGDFVAETGFPTIYMAGSLLAPGLVPTA